MNICPHFRLICCLTGLWLLSVASFAQAAETVTYERQEQQHTIRGEILVEAADGGLLMKTQDGVLWDVQPEEIIARATDNNACEPLDGDALYESVAAELPDGFKRFNTAHYLIIYNTSDAYAHWCGSLYERLHMGFTNYWQQRGHTLEELDTPLVALVFRDSNSYVRYAESELGEAANGIVGYYSMRTNRMAMYDLTGIEGQRGQQANSTEQVNRILAQPRAAATVSTIVHEATHQLAYNCGMQVRYADNPLWVSEGLAMFFETPDLNSRRGWRGIGEVNRSRLLQFQTYMRNRPADSLRTLVADDARFNDGALIPDAYAESWVLTHFLARRYREQYTTYLQTLGEKEMLLYDTPEQRIELFETTFGKSIEEIDRELLQYADRLN